MIIPNGHIHFRTTASMGMDSDGYPTQTAEAWGDAIACQILPSVNLRQRSQGEAVTQHSYTIYVERMELPSEVVKIYDERGEIGQFSIRSYEHLDAVCQTKILI